MSRLKTDARWWSFEDVDFAQLAQIYQELRKRWCGIGVPDAQRLREEAVYQVRNFDQNRPCQWVGSGGIYACRKDGLPMLAFDAEIEALLLARRPVVGSD